MILCIDRLLQTDELKQVQQLLTTVPYASGRRTAGWHALQVKHTEQANPAEPATEQADHIIHQAMSNHVLFQAACLPYHIRHCLFARYRDSMEYGSHVDDAIMGQPAMRADIAVTVFLNHAADYEGGELIIETSAGEQGYKLEAGQALVYPANTLHRVTSVTRGERQVAVTWIQSLIRSAEQREVLLELDTTRRQAFETAGKSPQFDRLSRVYSNLLRMWADT